jgi:hypothetical protein
MEVLYRLSYVGALRSYRLRFRLRKDVPLADA